MKLVVIDGQGGGVGKSIVHAMKQALPGRTVMALGTNAAATAAMLKGGADVGATGENAICYQCAGADVIIGVVGIMHANAMMGEISPAIAAAVSGSDAQKVLIPLDRCGLHIAGMPPQPLDAVIQAAVAKVAELCTEKE